MRIQCPACQTIYDVKADAIGGKGRQVRCAKCGDTWHATAMAEPAQAPQRAKSSVSQETSSAKPKKPAKAPAPKKAPNKPVTARQPSADSQFDQDVESDPVTDEDVTDRAAFSQAETATSTDESAATPGLEAETADMDGFARDDAAPFGQDDDMDPNDPAGEARPSILAGAVDAGLTKLQQARARIGIADDNTLTAPIAAPAKEKTPSVVKDYIKVAGAGMAALLLLFGPLLYRHQVVNMVPDMASFYGLIGLDVNLRGLDFQDIETFHENDGNTDILVVEGFLVNVDGRKRAVPAVRLALLGEDASELYAWAVEPRAEDLEPGETTRFRARLASPPRAATDVTLRFIDRSRGLNQP